MKIFTVDSRQSTVKEKYPYFSLTVDYRLSTVKIFSRKNLAIFHVFGDFLLRSRLNYLMFFEIHRILLTPEGDLRNFA